MGEEAEDKADQDGEKGSYKEERQVNGRNNGRTENRLSSTG